MGAIIASPRTPEVYRFGVSRKGDVALCLGAGRKKSDAVGITLPANLRTGAQVAPLRCLILRHGQKHYDDTTIFRRFQAACWPPIMALTGRLLRPCWPLKAAICKRQGPRRSGGRPDRQGGLHPELVSPFQGLARIQGEEPLCGGEDRPVHGTRLQEQQDRV
jgi:hypothetical protein